MQPIKLYGNHGPNPPKIAVLLAELDLPHEIQPLSMEEVKQAPFLAINPNGRMPAIHDPNTNFTVWESGAIIEYLLETYDKEHRLSFEHGTAEYWQARQLLFFQVSGQAPYYGQAAWFSKFHKEKLESAVERYAAEVNRVSGVIEGLLKEQAEKYGGNEVWLVGNRISYAVRCFQFVRMLSNMYRILHS